VLKQKNKEKKLSQCHLAQFKKIWLTPELVLVGTWMDGSKTWFKGL
jgi:hypothetical protein